MLYIHDSWNASIHEATAALPAFAFQSVPTSAHTRGDYARLRVSIQAQRLSVTVLIAPPFGGVEECSDSFLCIVMPPSGRERLHEPEDGQRKCHASACTPQNRL
jgi:hypothetical protein